MAHKRFLYLCVKNTECETMLFGNKKLYSIDIDTLYNYLENSKTECNIFIMKPEYITEEKWISAIKSIKHLYGYKGIPYKDLSIYVKMCINLRTYEHFEEKLRENRMANSLISEIILQQLQLPTVPNHEIVIKNF